MVLERQRLGAFHHGDAEVLVDALPDPHRVVIHGESEQQGHDAADDGPNQQAIAHGSPLRRGELGRGSLLHVTRRGSLGILAGPRFARFRLGALRLVRNHVLVAEQQQCRLRRLQFLPNQHLVGKQVEAEDSRHQTGRKARETKGEQREEMPEQRPHERPSAQCQTHHSPRPFGQQHAPRPEAGRQPQRSPRPQAPRQPQKTPCSAAPLIRRRQAAPIPGQQRQVVAGFVSHARGFALRGTPAWRRGQRACLLAATPLRVERSAGYPVASASAATTLPG